MKNNEIKPYVLKLSAETLDRLMKPSNTFDIEDLRCYGELEFIESRVADYLPAKHTWQEKADATVLFYRSSNTGRILKFPLMDLLSMKVHFANKYFNNLEFSPEELKKMPTLLEALLEEGDNYFPARLNFCATNPVCWPDTDIPRFNFYTYELVQKALYSRKYWETKPLEENKELIAAISTPEQALPSAAARGAKNRRQLQAAVLYMPFSHKHREEQREAERRRRRLRREERIREEIRKESQKPAP